MWVAAATYCAVIAPKNLLATLIGVLGMAHFSLGTFLILYVQTLSVVQTKELTITIMCFNSIVFYGH